MRGEKKPPVRRGIAIGDTALFMANAEETFDVADGFAVSVNGLVVSGKPSFEQAAYAGRVLPVVERAIQFALGDYINWMEETFGEAASQVIDYADGWSEKTCAVYAWMAKRIPSERRRMDRLSVAHHLAVAGLAPSQQAKWLERAAADGEERPWTVQRLRAAINASGDKEEETFWLMVSANSEEDQSALQEQMTAAGRSCKALVRRRTSKAKEEKEK